ncbi:MAG TPA: hypothetical protein VEF04_04790 [Blastocatellia bacterium]|nr:hypothetical protein [Blastocatellia bacterium]
MPRGLIKANSYYNRIEAVKDWNSLAQKAITAGRGDLIEQCKYKESAGWRAIDKQTAKLRAALEQQ